MKEHFERMADSILAVSELEHGRISARKKFALEAARLTARLYSEERPVAWCGASTPFELLHAMGVTACFVEFFGAILAATDAIGPVLEAAEQGGYSTDSCSFHRAVNGAALQSLLPKSAFLIATDCPCSNGFSTMEHLASRFQKPLFVIHLPQNQDAESVSYLADQFREMVGFVSRHMGRPMDSERLRKVIERSNRARDILVDVYRLAGSVPTPSRRRDMINFSFVAALLMGSQDAIELAQTYRDEFAERIANKAFGVPGERVRLMWYQNRIQFKNPLEKLMEDEFGAAVVADELNDVTWDPIDPDDPYAGLASRALNNPLVGPLDRRIEHLIRLARTNRVDGMINPCHWGCRQGTGARGLVEAGLKRAGIPVLNLEVDCLDPRNFAQGQVRTRLEAFIEMILAQKSKVH